MKASVSITFVTIDTIVTMDEYYYHSDVLRYRNYITKFNSNPFITGDITFNPLFF